MIKRISLLTLTLLLATALFGGCTDTILPRNVGNTAVTLSAEEALQIALTDAGFEKTEISRLRTELDRDDHTAHYDVSFHVGTTEYEYEIHADSGEICEKSTEQFDWTAYCNNNPRWPTPLRTEARHGKALKGLPERYFK